VDTFAELEESLQTGAGGTADCPVPELVIEVLIQSLRDGEVGSAQEANADPKDEIAGLFPSLLSMLQHPVVRHRVTKLVALARRIALDPLSPEESPIPKLLPLGQREVACQSLSTCRIAGDHSSTRASRIGKASVPRAATSTLPTAAGIDWDNPRGQAGLRGLPVGTIVTREAPLAVPGRIGEQRLRVGGKEGEP
jgi:hypothetical protein